MHLFWKITPLIISIGLAITMIESLYSDGHNKCMHAVVLLSGLFVFDKLERAGYLKNKHARDNKLEGKE
jgi:hypothetical protein